MTADGSDESNPEAEFSIEASKEIGTEKENEVKPHTVTSLEDNAYEHDATVMNRSLKQ